MANNEKIITLTPKKVIIKIDRVNEVLNENEVVFLNTVIKKIIDKES